MSTTIMPNAITTGTRRLQTLGAMWGLGSVSDVASGMLGEGWNPLVIKNLVDGGVSEAQLQNLWDSYNPGPEGYTVATALQNSLTPTSILQAPGISQAIDVAGTAYNSVISVAGQAFDLAKQGTWDAVASLLSSTRDQIYATAQLAPKDPDVIQHVQDFNAKVGQFAGWYQQLFGSSPSSIPLVPTLSGLGVAPLIIPVAILTGMAVVIAAAYAYGQWAQTKRAQLLAQTQQALISSGASPQQISAILNPGIGNWSTWLQQNAGLLIAGLAAIVIVPPLLRRR